MAGMRVPGRPGQNAPAGMQWSDSSKTHLTTPLQSAQKTQQMAQATAPQFSTDPLGRVQEWNATDQSWKYLGQLPDGGAGGGGTSRAAGSGGGSGGNNQALLAKIDDLWNRPAPQYSAPQQSQETGVNPADESYFAASKTRLGNTLQGGMDLLGTEMARRGISSDSRLAVGALGDLTRGALGEAADTERDLIFGRQDRNRNIADRNIDRTTQSLRDNQSAQVTAQSRLAGLLAYYGMAY